MTKAFGFAATDASAPLAPFSFERREPREKDVDIDILFCGVCHSDLHTARGEWGNTLYPSVPGHEIVGRVSRVGAGVSKFKVDDLVGVGCMVDSCRHCASCKDGLEQYCENGFTGTYNGSLFGGAENTYGGYSDRIVVDEAFVLKIPAGLDLAAAAPLLCAGITTYSPMRRWRVSAGQNVGVVGLGGLGHMAIQIAKAMGAHVTLFTTSPGKLDDAKTLGAERVVISKDAEAMAKEFATYDFIINTVAAPHDLDPYLNALKRDGVMCLVGAPASPHPAPGVFNLILKRRQLVGSLIGGVEETQEMLDFCAKHGIASHIETIPMQKINEAYERMLKSDVKYRFVIDMKTLKGSR